MEKVFERLLKEMEEKETTYIPMFWPTCDLTGKCDFSSNCVNCDQSPKHDEIIERSKTLIDIIKVNYPAVGICFDYECMPDIATEVAKYAKDNGLITIAYSLAPVDTKHVKPFLLKKSPFDIIQWFYWFGSSDSNGTLKTYLTLARRNNKAIIFSYYIRKEDKEINQLVFLHYLMSNPDLVAISIKNMIQAENFKDHIIFFEDDTYSTKEVRDIREDAIALHELFPMF